MSARSKPARDGHRRACPPTRSWCCKVIPMPADTNANGDIFGGWVMAQVDLAGSVLPARIAEGRMATVAVNEFIFKQPVRVGDICSLLRRASRASARTSITVQVEVYAERFRAQGAVREGDRGHADLRGHRRRGKAAAVPRLIAPERRRSAGGSDSCRWPTTAAR